MAGKRAGLGANPLDWIKDTTEKTEPEAQPKRKLRAKKKLSTSKTSEVQELQPSKVQEHEHGKTRDTETLELEETLLQGEEGKPVDPAFLESDPLYREYKEAQAHVPKYQQLEVKLYVLLREDQLESLSRLTRQIMKNRTPEYKRERITKNTIIRALIDNLNELDVDVRDIADEGELARRISDAMRRAA